MSIVSGSVGAYLGGQAAGDAADAQYQAAMKAMQQQRTTDLENRAFYMDLYGMGQDIYNRELMRAEPFREAGLFGLEGLIGTQAFQANVQPYVADE